MHGNNSRVRLRAGLWTCSEEGVGRQEGMARHEFAAHLCYYPHLLKQKGCRRHLLIDK